MKSCLLSLIAFAFFFSACTQQNEEDKNRTKVAGIVFQEDQFFRLIQFGMKDAANSAQAELLLGTSANKPDKEIQLVNTYLARKVDAIVISPLSKNASIAALKRAHEAGAKIITYNTTIDSPIPAAFIESDPEDLGAQTGEVAVKYIIEHLGGKAKVAILAFKSQAPEQSEARTRGFKQKIKQLPGVEIVAEQDAWLAEMAVKKAGDILTAHPEVNIIWAANEGGTVGSVMAVKNAGKTGKVAVFGTDTSEQLISFLLSEQNILQAITGQQPFRIGGMAIQAALKVLKGEKVEKKVSIPGVLLSRQDKEKILKFKEELKSLIGKG